MKTLAYLAAIVFACSQTAQAQNLPLPHTGKLQVYIDGLEGQQQFMNIPVANTQTATVTNWAKKQLLNTAPADYGFSVSSIKKSPLGTYYNFDLTYQNTAVFGRMAKVFIDNQYNIRCVYHNLHPLAGAVGTLPADDYGTILYYNLFSQLQLIENKPLWVNDGEKLLGCVALTLQDDASHTVYQQLFDAAGNLLYTRDIHQSAGPDTPAVAYVYDPDPLTTAHVIYGGNYSNNNGQDNADLQAQLKRRIVPVTLDGDSMILANDRFYITEISAPVWPTTKAHINDSFRYSRNHHSFGETNAYYHLNTYKNYINSLGYNLPGYKIQVDAHAFNGAENSQFRPTDQPPSLQFGDGGIPDAEDAEVVIHELGHALAYGAAPNTTTGNQRLAIDEGLGDYFAVSYTKDIDTFNWTKVFSWDGNNGSWKGRTINYQTKYPNLTNSKWTDGQIWSTSFIRIYDNTGRTTADKLMFETLYHLANNITMPQLAKATLLVDSLKNGGVNSHIIRCAFVGTGVFDDSTLQGCGIYLGQQPVTSAQQNAYTVHNTLGFAQGTGDAVVFFNKAGTYNLTLTDINGRIVWQTKNQKEDNYIISSQNIAAGMYLLTITAENGTGQTIKLIRH